MPAARKRPKPITGKASVLKEKRERARQFRRQPTPAEAATWELVRDRRLLGLKFRRQQVILGYIVDFYCPELGVVIEVEGGVHDNPDVIARDNQREQALTRAGVQIIRTANDAVCVEALTRSLRSLHPLSINGEGAGG